MARQPGDGAVFATPASVTPKRRPKSWGARLHSRRGGKYQLPAGMGQTINYGVGPIVAIEWGQAGLSKSLSYFNSVIDEVIHDSNTSDTYWAYIRRKALTMEREWVSRSRNRNGTTGS